MEQAPDRALMAIQIDRVAYRAGSYGKILVRSRGDETRGLTVEIADDRPGLPPGFDPEGEGGLRSRLMRALSQQLGARLERNPGALIRLTLRLGMA